jgi:fatty-acyl-CoA synthase
VILPGFEPRSFLQTLQAERITAINLVATMIWVEAVTAVVVLRAGTEASEAELIAHVAAQIASYKKPQRVSFAGEIPKTAVGKLNRKQLRDKYRQQDKAQEQYVTNLIDRLMAIGSARLV